MQPVSDTRIREAILTLLQFRGREKSLCPSEVARYLEPEEWRPLMDPVRAVALHLRQEGKIRITRGGQELTGPDLKCGPVRLKLR